MFDHFRRAPIRLQFIVLAAIPIPAILLSVIALMPEPFIFQNGPLQQTLAVRRAQIELVVQQLRSSSGRTEDDNQLVSVAPAGIEMKMLPWSAINIGYKHAGDTHFISDELRRILPDDFQAQVLGNVPEDTGYNALAIRIDAQRALVVRFPDEDIYPSFFLQIVEFVAKIIILILPMLLLVFYIGSMITSPLVHFAEAAKKSRPDDEDRELFVEAGAEELRALATSLNDMRRRIRKMVDDRTRMLTAVSHDLRTPLTRLRMRVERSADSTSRDAMLADITTLTTMIEESLQYLSSTATAEPLRKVDLSSLLQTIVSGFCDLGHQVTYNGPERYGYMCRQKALVRAITNIVENAVRFGTLVSIELHGSSKGEAFIIISDNGPGLDASLHTQVLKPFFKVDEARTQGANAGFGLGLSIADEIVKSHGGSLSLGKVLPHGLSVTIALPPKQLAHKQTGHEQGGGSLYQ